MSRSRSAIGSRSRARGRRLPSRPARLILTQHGGQGAPGLGEPAGARPGRCRSDRGARPRREVFTAEVRQASVVQAAPSAAWAASHAPAPAGSATPAPRGCAGRKSNNDRRSARWKARRVCPERPVPYPDARRTPRGSPRDGQRGSLPYGGRPDRRRKTTGQGVSALAGHHCQHGLVVRRVLGARQSPGPRRPCC